MSELNTQQSKERVFSSVTTGDVDTTLIGAAANKTDEYRLANFAPLAATPEVTRQIKLQSFTNGCFVHITASADAETGTIELWGYPEHGDAEFLGEFSYVADEMVDGEGRFYVDAFTLVTAAQHTVTILNFADGKAVLKEGKLLI